MADCSKTVDFIKARERMCDFYDGWTCDGCPLNANNNGAGTHCGDFVAENTEKAVELVQKWSDEHQEPKPKTYADDFFEKFPKASKSYLTQKDYESGIAFPTAKRFHIYGIGSGCCMEEDCTRERQARCWSKPYEEG